MCIEFTSNKDTHSCLTPSSKYINVTDIKCRTPFPLWIRLWKIVSRGTNFVPWDQAPVFLLVYLFGVEGATVLTLITELAKMQLTFSQPWGLKYSNYLWGKHGGDNNYLRFSIWSQPQAPFSPFHTKRELMWMWTQSLPKGDHNTGPDNGYVTAGAAPVRCQLV